MAVLKRGGALRRGYRFRWRASRSRDGAQYLFKTRRREDERIRQRIRSYVLNGDTGALRNKHGRTRTPREVFLPKLHPSGASRDQYDLILSQMPVDTDRIPWWQVGTAHNKPLRPSRYGIHFD